MNEIVLINDPHDVYVLVNFSKYLVYAKKAYHVSINALFHLFHYPLSKSTRGHSKCLPRVSHANKKKKHSTILDHFYHFLKIKPTYIIFHLRFLIWFYDQFNSYI